MRIRTARGALVALAMTATLLLPGAAALAQEEPAAPVSGSITVWSWDVAAAALERLAGGFMEANPGTSVEIVDVGYDNAYDKITVGLSAGSGLPDLVTIETDHMQPYIDAFPEGFTDLGQWAAPLADRFDPSKWAAASDAQGRLFALPWDSGTVGLFCRSDYLAQAGVDPASLVTWDDFVAAGEQVKQAIDIPMINVDVNGSDSIYAELLQQLGSGYFTPEGTIAVAGPESVQAMTLLKTLYDKGLIDNQQGWDARVTAAKEGTVVCQATGVWWFGTLTAEAPELSGKWTVLPLPVFEEGGSPTSNNGGSGLAIPTQAQNPALAWAFAEYALADAANQASMMENEGLFPAYLPAFDEPAMQAPQPYFGDQPVFRIFGELTPLIPPITYTADNSKASDQMTNTQSAILSGGQDVQAALQDAANQLANATGREIAS
jgi:lactose/L-arabinose transport system substrate-binding protein